MPLYIIYDTTPGLDEIFISISQIDEYCYSSPIGSNPVGVCLSYHINCYLIRHPSIRIRYATTCTNRTTALFSWRETPIPCNPSHVKTLFLLQKSPGYSWQTILIVTPSCITQRWGGYFVTHHLAYADSVCIAVVVIRISCFLCLANATKGTVKWRRKQQY